MGKRIGGSVDVYFKRGTNILWDLQNDPTTGVLTMKTNNAEIRGKGVELSLRSRNIDRRFNWTSEIHYSYVQNKVIDYDRALDANLTAQPLAGGNGMNIRGTRGKSPYSIFSYPFAGLDPVTGDPMGYLGKQLSKDYNGIFRQHYDTANLIYHGSAIPTSFGSLNNIFEYRGFTLLVSIQYKLGYYFKKNTINYFTLVQTGVQHADFSKRWKAPGDEKYTTIPSLIYPIGDANRDQFYQNSSANVMKGDNVRLQNIRLSYQFNRKSGSKMFAREIEVYANAMNLGLIWRANDQELDPDFNTGNAPYALPKEYTVGIKLNL